MANITAVLQLLPALIAAIKAIEDAVPGKGQGEAKLAAVREILESADKAASALWPILVPAIGALVKLFNATNWGK